MILASELRVGMTLSLHGQLFRVVEAVRHAGTAQQKGFVSAKLRNLRTGTLTEQRLRPDDPLPEVDLDKRPMEYLYSDGEAFYFMDPTTFDQVAVPSALIGENAAFLRANERILLELYQGEPVAVVFPDTVDLRVTRTAPPLRDKESHVHKPAVLENGLEVLVPQFVREGDVVRINVHTRTYVDRVAKGT